MSFKDTILYNLDYLTIEEVYDALISKEKMKHIVGSEVHGYGLLSMMIMWGAD